MLLTTGIIALSRKVADDRAKKREAKQGQLSIGSSDVARRAFESQTTKMLEPGRAQITHTGTDIQFEDAADVEASSLATTSPTIYSPELEKHDARHTSKVGITSPVESESAYWSAGTADTPTTTSLHSREEDVNAAPPGYSPMQLSAPTQDKPPVQTRPRGSSMMTATDSDSKSISTRSTNSRGTHAIRIKTKGTDLKSGFPYHPALFELRVHPEKWDSFTSEIVRRTKFDTGDYAKLWGAATATALTGAIATSVFVGRSMKRTIGEEKVKAGLEDMSDSGLGEYLRLWNEEYFGPQGLFVHLELSESAAKNAGRSRFFQKPASLYSSTEDRERKRDERKFMIVVTKLDDEGQPTEALHELAGEHGPVEIGSSGGPTSQAVELPAEVHRPVELPDNTPLVDSKVPAGYIEMDGDNSNLLEKLHLEPPISELPADPRDEAIEKRFIDRGSTHAYPQYSRP